MLFHVNMVYLPKKADRNTEKKKKKIVAERGDRNKIEHGLSDFSFMSTRMNDAIVKDVREVMDIGTTIVLIFMLMSHLTLSFHMYSSH